MVQEDEFSEDEMEEELTLTDVSQQAEVSLNSVVRLANPKTLRVCGCVGEQPVVVLIDPVATHNFILHKLIEVLKVPISAIVGYGVLLGNGDRISTSGTYQGVRLHLQGVEFIEDFIPLNL